MSSASSTKSGTIPAVIPTLWKANHCLYAVGVAISNQNRMAYWAYLKTSNNKHIEVIFKQVKGGHKIRY